jgi:hypothetical protein
MNEGERKFIQAITNYLGGLGSSSLNTEPQLALVTLLFTLNQADSGYSTHIKSFLKTQCLYRTGCLGFR